jgi:hypothetical protein
MKGLIALAAATFTLTLLPTSAVIASWPTDPAQNLPVATLLQHELPGLVPDGCGGAIITWTDWRVTIYNIRGQRVARLRRSFQPAGRQTITWDGLDDKGRKVASGVYFYRVEAGGFTQARKMVILR